MAVYDDQNPENEEDNALRERLGDLYNHDPKTMDRHSAEDEGGADDEDTTKRRSLRERDEAADEADTEDVKGQVRAGFLKAQEQDAADRGGEGGGFYRAAKGKIKAKANSKGKSSSNRNKIIVGASIGAATIGVGLIATLGNFFAVFKLDHILQNIDAKSFSRFNASFSDRSDQYLKAYMKMRLTELENPDGSYKETLLFKADKVDTDNPIRDWYRTLRAGSFEKELQNKTGIVFTGIRIEDRGTGAVTLRPARITLNNEEIAKLDPATSGLSPDSINKLKAGKLDNLTLQELNGLGSEADHLISDTHIFDDSKTARKALKNDVKDATHFWNVLKRRHVRKDIQNKTGITSWKFFETTRDKITNKKIQVQQKILRKVLPNNKAGDFIKCVLGAGNCVASTDDAAPENQHGSTAAGNPLNPDDADTSPTESIGDDGNQIVTRDKDGNPIITRTAEYGAKETADELEKTAAENASEAVINKHIGGDIALSPLQRTVADQINNFASGNIYTKAWSWAKKLAKIDRNITGHKFTKLVKVARLSQLSAIYATYSIMRDQGKSGQLTADEFGEAMTTLNDVGQSEGWINSSAPASGNTVSAEAATAQTNANKTDYCKMNTTKQQANEIHYFCDSPGDSNADKIEAAYKSSVVYDIIHPIAEAVNEINDSVVGVVLNTISSAVDSILSKVLDPIITAALEITGAQDALTKALGFAMTKVMSFLGAGPMFDGSQPGAANFIMAGSAATAEASTRDSGGVVSTPATLDYTNKLAANYEKERASQESLFDRYASLSNTKSLFSTALFSVANFNISTDISHALSSFGIIPKTVGSLFGGNAFAAVNDFNPASWAGVDTYDIPPACQGDNLNPLDPDYTAKAVGVVADSPYALQAQDAVNKIKPQLTMALERDSAQFWKLVYDEIGKDPAQEEIAGAIYNCALFDQRVMGGIGYTSGYSADGGLNDGSPAASQDPTASVDCTNVTGNEKIICAAKGLQNVRYANKNSGTGDKWLKQWGVTTIAGSLGQIPKQWLAERIIDGNNDFMECSGYVKTSIYVAFGVTVNAYCSAVYLTDTQYFDKIDLSQIKPGDLLIESDQCGNAGHIAIFVGKTATGRFSTMESASDPNLTGQKKTGSYERRADFFKYAARYKGPGATQ